MEAQPYNAWRLVSLSPLPGWVLGGLLALAALGVALAAMGVRKEPVAARRMALWVLRGAAGLFGVFFLLEPGIRNMQVARVKNRVAVLIDRSASMGFPVQPAGPTRSEQAAVLLERSAARFAGWSERFAVELYGFSPELAPTDAQQLHQEAPRAGRTDLLAALRAVQGSEGAGQTGKRLSGVVLVSDGSDNAELRSGLGSEARQVLKSLGVPISTVLVGQETLRDLAIESVKVDDFAFVRNSISTEVEVRARGYSGREIPVVLRREGQVLATRNITVRTDDDVQVVSFAFTPDQTGRYVYTVAVPVFPDESVSENNTRSFSLKVIRDRVRVLLVVGRPSWDERFLRGLLRQDPNVDLISFYILRTMSDDPQVRNQERELSLIPFPMDEIFNTKLDTFDVVVFQNFGYTDPALSISTYERNLEQYVHKGGAFVMIGGDRAFGEGRATFTTLGQALPVEPAGPLDLAEFRPRLTPDGLRHPVTALAGPAGTQAAWSNLPVIPGANITRAKPGATVLLDHPHATSGAHSAPVLALWDYGRGRSMALTTDASWYWAFLANAQGSSTRLYDRFWSNALRWLVRDPDLTTLKVAADPSMVEPGRPVGVIVTARLPDYQPAPGAEVKVDLFSVETQRVVATQSGAAGADGVLRLEFPAPAPGPYKLLASARKGERSLGEGEDAVAVRAVGPELADASVRPRLLEELADASGGKALRFSSEGLPEVPLIDPPVVEVGRSKDRPLWDRWYYLMMMVLLLGSEWALRRRFGYV